MKLFILLGFFSVIIPSYGQTKKVLAKNDPEVSEVIEELSKR